MFAMHVHYSINVCLEWNGIVYQVWRMSHLFSVQRGPEILLKKQKNLLFQEYTSCIFVVRFALPK